MKHTPTPWDVDGNERNLFVIAKTETLPTVARATGLTREEAEANARFIVRAVNSHEAWERLLNVSLDLLSDVYDSRASQRFSAIGLSRIKSHITDLRAALAEKES